MSAEVLYNTPSFVPQFCPDGQLPRYYPQFNLNAQENASSTWGTSPLATSSYDEIPSYCTPSEISPSWQTTSPSTPSRSAWISIADSGHGNFTNSSHGSRSSQADSMMHATHYFANTNLGYSPCAHAGVPFTATLDSPQTRETPIKKPGGSGQRARVRHDAHSKVEKRYRMNINSKIEQLKDMLTVDCPPRKQSLTETTSVGGSRNRKSGAELSKRDVLTRTISLLLHLQDELQQMKCQNLELKAEIAQLKTLATSA